MRPVTFEKRTGLSDQLKLYGGDAANGPDMYLWAHDSLGTFVAMDILEPLTDLVDESVLADDLPLTVEARPDRRYAVPAARVF